MQTHQWLEPYAMYCNALNKAANLMERAHRALGDLFRSRIYDLIRQLNGGIYKGAQWGDVLISLPYQQSLQLTFILNDVEFHYYDNLKDNYDVLSVEFSLVFVHTHNATLFCPPPLALPSITTSLLTLIAELEKILASPEDDQRLQARNKRRKNIVSSARSSLDQYVGEFGNDLPVEEQAALQTALGLLNREVP